MSLMRVRVPAMRDMIEMSRAEQVKATARLLDRKGMLPTMPEGFEDLLDHMTVSIDPHQSLHAIPTLLKGFNLILNQLSFEIIHNRTDIAFLSSDNPVIYFDPSMSEVSLLPYQVCPPLGLIEFLFPIDTQTTLRGRTGRLSLRHLAITDRQIIKRINRFVARFAYRFVFSRDRNHGALIAKFAGESPVLKSTTLQGPTGEEAVFLECVFGRRPTKPKWKPSNDLA